MNAIKKDFPLLSNSNLLYFDNAATTHKPQHVIETITNFYQHDYATIHRSMYALSERATQMYEKARNICAEFINARPEEIILTSGTTAGINFVATAWALHTIKKDNEIVLTQLEHHSNLIPWQQISQQTGAHLKFIPITADGCLDLNNLESIITPKTKLVSFIHSSHVLGTQINPEPIIQRARQVGATVLIDAAQSIAHKKIDVQSLDVDFLVFSGHKIMGPTGVGVLYIKKEMQKHVPPYQFGGGMILHASYDHAQWLSAPHCYEAGTPPIAQVIGLGAALQYFKNNINYDELKLHEASLCKALIEGLQNISFIRILGPIEELKKEGHLVSFIHEKYHHHDIGAYLDTHNIAVRAGHYCAQPLAKTLNITGAVRVSFFGYNSMQEVETLLEVLRALP